MSDRTLSWIKKYPLRGKKIKEKEGVPVKGVGHCCCFRHRCCFCHCRCFCQCCCFCHCRAFFPKFWKYLCSTYFFNTKPRLNFSTILNFWTKSCWDNVRIQGGFFVNASLSSPVVSCQAEWPAGVRAAHSLDNSCNVRCTAHCTMHTVHCTLHITHHTLHTA